MSFCIEKSKKKFSFTNRRKHLTQLAEEFKNEMPTKCTSYAKASRVYRVYMRSSRYSACNSLNDSSCDIQVTALEFRQLVGKRKFSRKKIAAYWEELAATRLALDTAYKQYSTALAKKSRLLQTFNLNKKRANKLIAIKERNVQEQKVEEF